MLHKRDSLTRKLLLVTALLSGGLALGAARFDFAVIGDVPYNTEEEATYSALSSELDAAKPAFIVHVGEMHADPRRYRDGLRPCTPEILQDRKRRFDASRAAFILTLGDNDWPDCRFAEPPVDVWSQLAQIRSLFFAGDWSLGRHPIRLTRQSSDSSHAEYRENVWWRHGDVLFLTLHIVGANNNRGVSPELDAEFQRRNTANRAWLAQAFDRAARESLRAIVVFSHANPAFDRADRVKGFCGVTPGEASSASPSGFEDVLNELVAGTVAFGGPVVLVHGDTHYFRIDQPLCVPGTRRVLPNFTRVESFGSPSVGWIRISVDTAAREMFAFRVRPVEPVSRPVQSSSPATRRER